MDIEETFEEFVNNKGDGWISRPVDSYYYHYHITRAMCFTFGHQQQKINKLKEENDALTDLVLYWKNKVKKDDEFKL